MLGTAEKNQSVLNAQPTPLEDLLPGSSRPPALRHPSCGLAELLAGMGWGEQVTPPPGPQLPVWDAGMR